MSHHEVGFIGLGAMGFPMAQNLQQYLSSLSKSLHVYNRTIEKANPLRFKGSTIESSPLDIAKKCNIIFCMVFNDEALMSTVKDLLPSLKKGCIFISCVTALPETLTTIVEELKTIKVDVISCPVFGRPDAAAEKKLITAMAGAPERKMEIKPYVEAMSKKVIDVGENAATANVLKLVGNFTIASMIHVSGEAMTLGEKNGLNRNVYIDLLSEIAPSPIWLGYAQRIAKEEYITGAGGFNVNGGIKDLSYMKRIAENSESPTPFLDLMMNEMTTASKRGWGNLDWSAMAKVLQEDAGVLKSTPKPHE